MKHSTPKAAKAATAPDPVALSRTGTDLDALDAALADARGRIEAATGERDAADTAYRDGLLDAEPAELERLQAVKGRATVDLDRAEALVAALTRRIASVRADRDRDERKARHAEAAARVEAICARLPVEYREHALAIRHLLRDLAEAEVARQAAEPLMREFGFIAPPEDAPRGLDRLPEEIIEQDEVALWTIDGRAEPLPAERQAEVHSTGGAGRGQLVTGGSGVPFECTRRRYRRTRYRAAVNPPSYATSLLNAVNLPPLHIHGEDFVTAERMRGADTALDHLGRDLAEPGPLDRPVQERLEMLPDPPRAASLRSVA